MNASTTTEQAAVAAPAVGSLFVTVPETTLPGGLVVSAFQVAKYLASEGADGKLAVSSTGSPLVDINYHEARKACADAGYALITETQALSLAWNLSRVAANWIGGVVGEGSMYQGLHLDLDDVDEPYAFDFVSPNASERREFFLADGSVVLDAAGNAYTWVFDDVQGDEQGVVARAFAADSPSITTAPFPSMQKGMGWQPKVGSDWSGSALFRGGCWCSLDVAGVFVLLYDSPVSGHVSVGVRCTLPVGL